MEFLKNWFSIDEQRVSATIISLFVTMGLVIYGYLNMGDISGNLLTLAQTIILTVGGVNTVDKLGNIFNKFSGGNNISSEK